MKSANTREADRRRLDATLANWMQMMVSITRGVNMIDPKPMTDFSALPCISELEVAQNGIGIPLSVYPPAICSSFGDHLQVVVMNALSFTAQYITFDATGEFEVLVGGRGLTLGRTYGNQVQLELMRMVDGQLTRREIVPHAAQLLTPTIAAVADRYVMLRISESDRSLDVQWFDWNLASIEPASTILTLAPGPVRLRSARLIQGNTGYLAIGYQTVTTGDGSILHRSDGTTAIREPPQPIEQFVAAYDWNSHKLDSFQRIVPPGISYNTGCWIGDTLFMLHGEGDLMISVYQGRKTG